MQMKIKHGVNYQYVHDEYPEDWDCHMQRISLHSDEYFFIHDIGHFISSAIYEGVRWDLFDTVLYRNPIVILSAHAEGPSWLHVRRTVEHMIDHYSIDPKRIILWSGSAANGSEPCIVATSYQIFVTTIDEHAVLNQNYITHHYAMLARVPKTHRVKAAVELLERGLDCYGKISCGSGQYGDLSREQYDKHVPAKWQNLFPMLLDGFIMNSDVRQYNGPLQLTEITGAFFQIIPETAHEWDTPGWIMPFLTEKSAKCFLLKQVPIWRRSVGQAKMARDLGFNLFDDLVDHTYDTVADPTVRLNMVMDQVERLCKTPLPQLIEYRADNANRFDNNYQLLLDIKYNLSDIKHKTIMAALDKCCT